MHHFVRNITQEHEAVFCTVKLTKIFQMQAFSSRARAQRQECAFLEENFNVRMDIQFTPFKIRKLSDKIKALKNVGNRQR